MRARWLARLLRRLLQRRIAIARPPDFQVVREDKAVYLRRWWVLPRNDYCNVYLHHMIGSDDDVLHDHEYVSVSLALTDGLRERWCRMPARNSRTYNLWMADRAAYVQRTGLPLQLDPARLPDPYRVQERTICEGQLVWRSSSMAHQLIVDRPAWTLFVTGPRVKQWGFWCRRGFVHWRDYVGVGGDPSKTTSGGAGRGCGEMS
jgi:hypothetical protein